MSILVTGAAGFIGFHVCKRLINEGFSVIGYDNLNDYYERELKEDRLEYLKTLAKNLNFNFEIIVGDLEDETSLGMAFKGKDRLGKMLSTNKPSKVINLAAQAGVRYSLENPKAYIKSNLEGFSNILEFSRENSIEHLVYASSSSVYGGNKIMPFSESHSVDHPVSIYAASKKSNELMAHSYNHLFNIPTTGLRFFTVYGPWGRPDMALFKFTQKILNYEPIEVFNNGNMIRDFTYIDDIVEGIIRILNKPSKPDPCFNNNCPNPSSSWAPYRIFNIGNSTPVPLMDYIEAIEKELGITSKKTFLPMQPGDVEATSADTKSLEDWISYKPKTSIKDGIREFITWYKNYYSKK